MSLLSAATSPEDLPAFFRDSASDSSSTAADADHFHLSRIAQRSAVGALQPPFYENDVKERTKELLFGFHKYIERADVYSAKDLLDVAYIPKWFLGMLGLAVTDESRAYQRNPSLKRTRGNFFIAPNPFYFNYDAYACRPWDMVQESKSGFRLCVWWVHPVLQELSPYFDRQPEAVLNSELVEQLDKKGLLYELCRAVARIRNHNSVNESEAFVPEELLNFDATMAIPLNQLQLLAPVKYLHTWRDCGVEHVDELRQLQTDVHDFLREEFRMNEADVAAAEMVFHSTTRVRNPNFGDQTRGQYLHLHLQVYAGRAPDAVYVPSISCMQRSAALCAIVEALAARGDIKELAQFPHEYYDESEDFETFSKCSSTTASSTEVSGTMLLQSSPLPKNKKTVPATSTNRPGLLQSDNPEIMILMSPDEKLERSPQRIFSTAMCRTECEMEALRMYHGLAGVFDSADWTTEEVMFVLRRCFCGEKFAADWTLDARRRKRPPQLHLVVGAKGVGKTTYVKQAICNGGLGAGNLFFIDGCNMRSEDLMRPKFKSFQFKLQILRWCVRYGFDVVMTRSKALDDKSAEWLQIVEEEEEALSRTHSHPLKYQVAMHVVVAACGACASRAVKRDRAGDTAPCTYAQHRDIYKASLEAVAGKMKIAARIDNLIVVDNSEDCTDQSKACATFRDTAFALPTPHADRFLAKMTLRACASGFPFEPHLVSPPELSGETNPSLVLIRGPPGAGKTTLWRTLSSDQSARCDLAGDMSGGGGRGMMSQAVVVDGELFCQEFAKEWGFTQITISLLADDQHARAARDTWKQRSVDYAFSNQHSLIVPITVDVAKARALAKDATKHGYAVEVWVCLAEAKTNEERLQQRHLDTGTPGFDEEVFKRSYGTLCREYPTAFNDALEHTASTATLHLRRMRFFRDGKELLNQIDIDTATKWVQKFSSHDVRTENTRCDN
ncbi:unnamed protein product [Amoebophrya sp. A120]|nr:unnamed protein product [Amoebophrya sp. A120]|eukprot:GSA120T00002366001.1